MDLIDKIMEYEAGQMSIKDTIDFFADLIKTGKCWSLQGHYGRMANQLIGHGFIDRNGKVLQYPEE